MTRRGVFAALAAPFLARFAPKPKARYRSRFIDNHILLCQQEMQKIRAQYMCASNIIVPGPRTGFKLAGPTAGFTKIAYEGQELQWDLMSPKEVAHAGVRIPL